MAIDKRPDAVSWLAGAVRTLQKDAASTLQCQCMADDITQLRNDIDDLKGLLRVYHSEIMQLQSRVVICERDMEGLQPSSVQEALNCHETKINGITEAINKLGDDVNTKIDTKLDIDEAQKRDSNRKQGETEIMQLIQAMCDQSNSAIVAMREDLHKLQMDKKHSLPSNHLYPTTPLVQPSKELKHVTFSTPTFVDVHDVTARISNVDGGKITSEFGQNSFPNASGASGPIKQSHSSSRPRGAYCIFSMELSRQGISPMNHCKIWEGLTHAEQQTYEKLAHEEYKLWQKAGKPGNNRPRPKSYSTFLPPFA